MTGQSADFRQMVPRDLEVHEERPVLNQSRTDHLVETEPCVGLFRAEQSAARVTVAAGNFRDISTRGDPDCAQCGTLR